MDMLKTSKGSCLRARRRKRSRTLLLKLFSRCLAFIMEFRVPRTLTGLVASHHVAVAGFWSASFEGGRKSIWRRTRAPVRLLVVQIRRGLAATACHEIQLEKRFVNRSSVSDRSGS